jgi:hypothetical protein
MVTEWAGTADLGNQRLQNSMLHFLQVRNLLELVFQRSDALSNAGNLTQEFASAG